MLAKEIILMHGGSVVVESEEGKGSAFGFCIPFEVAKHEHEHENDCEETVSGSSGSGDAESSIDRVREIVEYIDFFYHTFPSYISTFIYIFIRLHCPLLLTYLLSPFTSII